MSAATMTYDSLVEDIKTYSERANDPVFVSQIDRFIMYAENRLAVDVKTLGFQRYVNGQFDSNTLEKPSRWRETISFNYTNNAGQRVFLKERSYDYCRTYSPDPTETGAPVYYANYDYEHFFFAPTPDAGYEFELGYYERPEPLSSENQTNWTTRYAPQLLLYACLLEAAPFVKNPEQVQQWQAFYEASKAQVLTEATRRVGDRTDVRNGE